MAGHIDTRFPQAGNQILRLGAVQPLADISGGDGADVIDGGQLLLGGSSQCVKGAKMRGQYLGGLVAYLSDAQCADEPPQVVFLTLFNGGQHIGGGFFPHTIQPSDILSLQVIQISGSSDKTAADQRLDHRRAHTVDIHGAAAGKMGQVPQQLGRALRTGAAYSRAVLVTAHRCAAHGADRGQIVRYRAGGALVLYHLYDLRDDLPRLLDDHGIPDADVL